MDGTLNKVILIGNLGDDPKIIRFENNNMLARFPLATSESYIKKDTNERVVNTEWHNIVMRNKQAEISEKYMKKGDKLYIEGKLKTRKYEDQGQTKYMVEVFVDEFKFLTPKKGSDTVEEKDIPF